MLCLLDWSPPALVPAMHTARELRPLLQTLMHMLCCAPACLPHTYLILLAATCADNVRALTPAITYSSQWLATIEQSSAKHLMVRVTASKGLRRWEDLFRQAAQLRTDLRVAKAKAQDEAQEAADYASQLSQQNFALTDSMQVKFSILHI